MRTSAILRRSILVLIMAGLLIGFQAGSVQALSTTIVISEIYGGGGNSGATYMNDFIELYNNGTSPVSLTGWSVQYASATGTGNFGANSTIITELTGTLSPGQYLLIQEAQGAGGTISLPTPGIIDSSPIAMSATGGKVALVSSTASLACNGGSTPCSPTQLALIVDLVGWDGANFFETAPGPATTNPTSLSRIGNGLGGLQETDNNSADFTVGAPSPTNTTTATVPEPTTMLLLGLGLVGMAGLRRFKK